MDANGLARSYSGTSLATSVSSGVGALMMSARPQASVFEVKEALIRGATYNENIAGIVAAQGRLSAFLALHKLGL